MRGDLPGRTVAYIESPLLVPGMAVEAISIEHGHIQIYHILSSSQFKNTKGYC